MELNFQNVEVELLEKAARVSKISCLVETEKVTILTTSEDDKKEYLKAVKSCLLMKSVRIT